MSKKEKQMQLNCEGQKVSNESSLLALTLSKNTIWNRLKATSCQCSMLLFAGFSLIKWHLWPVWFLVLNGGNGNDL